MLHVTDALCLQVLPEDAHLRVNGKLHISLTRVYDGRNVIVSQFGSREDLVQVRQVAEETWSFVLLAELAKCYLRL
jgi:hypothetical protein